MRGKLLSRIGIFVTGLILARFVPSRTARRFISLMFAPAIVTFFLERGFGRSGRDPRNAEKKS